MSRVPDRFFGIQRDPAGFALFEGREPKWERGAGLKLADFSFER